MFICRQMFYKFIRHLDVQTIDLIPNGRYICSNQPPICDNLVKGNYRPVSVLTTISKIYESVVNDQMYDFFNELFEGLLTAFRKGYSCQSLLVKFIDDIKRSVDQGDIVGTVFMDLSKAFDCLPHGLLIAKLNAYGVSMLACELLSSYHQNATKGLKWQTVGANGNLLLKVYHRVQF